MPEPVPSPLADWNDAVDRLSPRDPRVVGRWMIWVGSLAIIAGMFFTPPWANLGLGVGIAGVLLSRTPLHRLPVLAVGAAFSAWLLLSVAAGVWRGQPHGGQVPGVLHAWLGLPLLAAAAVDHRWRRWALRGLVVAAAVAGAVALAQFCIGFDLESRLLKIGSHGERFTLSRGFSASHLMLGFAGALTTALAVQPRPALAAGAAWTWAGRGLGILVLAICGSRAALVGGVAGLGSALAARGRRWLLLAVAVALVLAAALVGRMAISDSRRLHSMLEGENGRWAIWTTSLALAAEHPLVGMGGRNAYMFAYNDAFARVLPGKRNEFGDQDGCAHAHNWLLALVAEHGWPAAILHLTLVGTVLAVCWRRRREHPGGWTTGAAVATTAVVAGIFEPLPTLAVPGAAFHACLGVALGMAYAGGGRVAAGADAGAAANPA